MNQRKETIIIALMLAVLSVITFPAGVLHAEEGVPHNYKPAGGYVPNNETAIAIAVAVWNPIYGKENIEKKKPFKATLKEGIWYVTGSLPFGWVGGVPEAEISKDDGRILRVTHGK
jgi:hypothetical protein